MPQTKPKDIKSDMLNLAPSNIKVTMSGIQFLKNRNTKKQENVTYIGRREKRLSTETDSEMTHIIELRS